ncbi:MAG: hypothetical protein M3N56_10500 [Actinomycetota bacterium]|nr:hypothetical protein [Actinomycetota bacterium]
MTRSAPHASDLIGATAIVLLALTIPFAVFLVEIVRPLWANLAEALR